MTLLKDSITAALENRPIRDSLSDELSIHVNRMVITSIFNLGTAGEGLIHYGGRHLGSTLVERGEVHGETVEAVLAELIAVLNKLKLGNITLVEAEGDSAKVQFEDCHFCKGLPVIGRGVCFYDSGILVGALQKALGREFKAEETKCHCKGDKMCLHEISGI